ncbi:OstA-like protein [Sediminicola luteus]|uniref:OstA-like protein n=1 Tax=Sediminicola luteus TaxID=319238 RepID=A0A2A4G8B4_9FLAO|nr:OstA-like protein [Sediminicola luteus]
MSAQTPNETDSEADKKINIIYGANFTINEELYPGGKIFSKDEQQLHFEHQGADLYCDIAVLYPDDNSLRAIGNIRMQQGDSIEMTGQKLRYDGNSRMAKAWESVRLTDGRGILTTDTLYFDRENQKAYYQDGGKVVDSANTLTSKLGTYFTGPKKFQFEQDVVLVNPDNRVESTRMDYFDVTKSVYLYGPSTITGDTYKMYCERGFYDTTVEQGYGVKNTRIDYNDRKIYGDSLYFDRAAQFASATNNIKVIDTINNSVIKAHYAEVYRAKDSVFATKRAVAISLVEQDSLYMHGDTLMITGPAENRVMRAFRNAKFFKTNLSGKCDSIHSSEKSGVTQLIRNPILWNVDNQMTGDSIHLISNTETEKMDSLKVINNAFIISLDTISKTGYNQAKGIHLYGRFVENELKYVDLVKNTEVIYYMYNDDQELLGINKTVCSRIEMVLANNDIEDLNFVTNPDGTINPEKDVPPNSRKLKGFVWRGDERIYTKHDIFDEDDNNIQLVKIRGIDNTLLIEEEEAIKEAEKREKEEENDPIPKANDKAILDKPKKQR